MIMADQQKDIFRVHLREARASLQDWCLRQSWTMLTEILHCLGMAICL